VGSQCNRPAHDVSHADHPDTFRIERAELRPER